MDTASSTIPRIACIGVIGKHDEPLHIAQFPPHTSPDATVDFHLLLNSSLDLFDIRKQQQPVIDQDLGLLHAFDEQFAAYGWLTNTGTKFVIVVDMEGKAGRAASKERRWNAVVGLRDADLKPAFRALQTAYIKLLQNPFYSPQTADPISRATFNPFGNTAITNATFIADVKQIGEVWRPGVTSIPV
ncbi:hypothetical protein KEM52_001957 [Ascosphaera acerosa]|nr:hypothetical protein KEM52_001957 [Ascosphaera acerosa]